MQPLPAARALDQFFLEARARILDVAAILDRIDRGGDGAVLDADPRLERIHRALAVLQGSDANRAEQVQQIFSLEYDAAWVKPKPRF